MNRVAKSKRKVYWDYHLTVLLLMMYSCWCHTLQNCHQLWWRRLKTVPPWLRCNLFLLTVSLESGHMAVSDILSRCRLYCTYFKTDCTRCGRYMKLEALADCSAHLACYSWGIARGFECTMDARRDKTTGSHIWDVHFSMIWPSWGVFTQTKVHSILLDPILWHSTSKWTKYWQSWVLVTPVAVLNKWNLVVSYI